MTTVAARPPGSRAPVETVLREILDEIAVPMPVIREARKRRKLILDLALEHDAARRGYGSGSLAHGTTNRPLEDADCGVVVNRRYEAFRAFGPDAPDGGRGPRKFVAMYAEFLEPRVRQHYANAAIDLTGKRAIKIEFNDPVEIDDWGPVDPYVDFIVGLAQAERDALWIPNLYEDSWDPGDPIHHTWLMTERDDEDLRVLRAKLLRLAKRAVKRDEAVEGKTAVMCSWNLSALALESVEEVSWIADGLAVLFEYASEEIALALTEDPSPAIEDPINLPQGVSNEQASQRLAEMAAVIEEACSRLSIAGARTALAKLYGPEIDAVSEREGKQLEHGVRTGDRAAVAGVLGAPSPQKATRSYRARSDLH